MSRIDDLIYEHCPDGVEFMKLMDVARIRNGKDFKGFGAGDVPVYGTGGVMTHIDTYVSNQPSVLIPRKGSLNKLYFVDVPFWTVDTIFYTEIYEHMVPKFFYYFLQTQRLEELNQAGGVPSLTQSVLNELRIPVPPVAVQREIVRVLDSFASLEAELEGELEGELECRARQHEHYRSSMLKFPKGLDRATLGDLVLFINGKPHERLVDVDGDVALMTARFISTQGRAATRFVHGVDVLTPATHGDVALVMSDLPNGRALARAFFVDTDGRYAANQRVCLLRVVDETHLLPRFLYHVVNRDPQLLRYDNGQDQTHLRKGQILGIDIPVPSLEEQTRIVATLDKFGALAYDLMVSLPAEIKARRRQYEYYRDRLLTFEERAA